VLKEHSAEHYYRALKSPIGIDLFAGAGGFSLGFIEAGFEVVAAVDSDPICAITYMHNLGKCPCQFHFVSDSDEEKLERRLQKAMKPGKGKTFATPTVAGAGWISHYGPEVPGVGHFFLGDIRQLSGRDILEPLDLKPGDVDCVMGGPPCQGFTTAGKRDVMDPRNAMVFEFARLVCEIRPKTCVMENVPGILNMVTPEGLPIVDAFCRILEDGGFAGYKSLLKSMESQTGVALLKGKTASKKKKKRKKAPPQDEPLLF
jgi:DNA (cytosine-5)-methyltransferase 1